DDGVFRVSSRAASTSVRLTTAPVRVEFLNEDRTACVAIDSISLPEEGLSLGGRLARHERLYGTGERFDAVDRRGRAVHVWAEDRWCETEGNSYLPVPFVLSTGGYGLFVNRFEGMTLDLGEEDPDRWAVAELDAPLDLYVFVDKDPRAILDSLSALTGRAPTPPDWAFGMLVSRHARTKEFATADGVRGMAAAMDELDLPWSGVIVEGWPTYDVGTYGDLEALCDELHAAGKKVLVYDACGRVRGPLVSELPEADSHCVRRADGSVDLEESAAYNPADAPDRRTSRFLDLTDRDAVRWWTDEVWGRLLDEVGVDGAKIDFCEQFPEHDDLQLTRRSPKGMHHYYPVRYNTMMYRLFQERRRGGGVCWSRGGGIGAARYPWVWCGDQRREFRFLRAILRAALSLGLSGVPFLGHDLGGYMPAEDPEANPEPEVFARGCQLACFGPVMSTHGTVTRPYDFEPEIVDLYRLYSKVHYALVPYLVEQFRAGAARGLPLMRHMVLHLPTDKIAQGIEDQYFLGEELLVAPVLEWTERRNVYLPSGGWQDVFTGTWYRGPVQLASYAAPLERTPVFVKEHPSSPTLPGCLDEIRGEIERAT
ncbi:MAG: glycoside hydrolase family 31 protein, partial [Planctomycetota bacterium]